jgi:hypothetical protein
VRGLEDYDDYIRLRDRKVRVNRWALGIVSGMLVLKFLEERTAHRFDRIGVIVAAVGLVAFALAAAYGITLTFHYTVYKCPQCSDRFGLGDECRLCGFPRKKITV